MCLNPAFAAFVLFLPRDAQNRNKIKLFERALLLFQAAINSFQFIRIKIKLCHFGLDWTGFYFLPIPKKKFPHSLIRGNVSYRGSILTSFCKDEMQNTECYRCLSKPGKISQNNRLFFFNADVFTGILPSNKFEKEITWMRAGVHFQVP